MKIGNIILNQLFHECKSSNENEKEKDITLPCIISIFIDIYKLTMRCKDVLTTVQEDKLSCSEAAK